MRLPAGVSATPGPVRLSEFQRGLADAISDPKIPRVSVLKAVRCGYSTLLVAAVAAYAANDPNPIIVLVPTTDDARTFMVHHGRDADPRNAQHQRLPGTSAELWQSRAGQRLSGRSVAAEGLGPSTHGKQLPGHVFLSVSKFSGLQKVTEAGEIKAMTTGEAKEGYALETFGGTFPLSRKAQMSDDLGALARWGEMMGRAAAETECAPMIRPLAYNCGQALRAIGRGPRLRLKPSTQGTPLAIAPG